MNSPLTEGEVDRADYSTYETSQVLQLLSDRVLDETAIDNPRRDTDVSVPGEPSLSRITDDLKRRMGQNDKDTQNEIREGIELVFARLKGNHVPNIRLDDAIAITNILTGKQ